MCNPRRYPRATALVAVLLFLFLFRAAAQEKKEFSYAVGPKAMVFITNHYGPITVKPSGNMQVGVTTVSHSPAVSFMNERHGNRVDLRAESSLRGTDLADYTVLVPGAVFVSLRSSDGSLRVQGLHGDVVLEAVTASVEVTDVTGAHVHVKSLSGPITLTDIHNSHLEVHSMSGNISLHNVIGSSVVVNSGSGRITYDGDPGATGEYLLTTYSGDLDVSIPASASVEIKARSLKGESDRGVPNSDVAPARGRSNLLLKPEIVSTSRFVLHSFRGKIRLKRP